MTNNTDNNVKHYTVDAEPQQTTKSRLSAADILTNAGLAPDEFYLVKEEPTHESYRGTPDMLVEMLEGQVFVSVHFGPKQVS